jgi:hypothetical protein
MCKCPKEQHWLGYHKIFVCLEKRKVQPKIVNNDTWINNGEVSL